MWEVIRVMHGTSVCRSKRRCTNSDTHTQQHHIILFISHILHYARVRSKVEALKHVTLQEGGDAARRVSQQLKNSPAMSSVFVEHPLPASKSGDLIHSVLITCLLSVDRTQGWLRLLVGLELNPGHAAPSRRGSKGSRVRADASCPQECQASPKKRLSKSRQSTEAKQ